LGRAKRNLGITNRPGSKSTSCEGEKKKKEETQLAPSKTAETSGQIRIVDRRVIKFLRKGVERQGKEFLQAVYVTRDAIIKVSLAAKAKYLATFPHDDIWGTYR